MVVDANVLLVAGLDLYPIPLELEYSRCSEVSLSDIVAATEIDSKSLHMVIYTWPRQRIAAYSARQTAEAGRKRLDCSYVLFQQTLLADCFQSNCAFDGKETQLRH